MTLPKGLAPPAILHIHAHTTTQLAAQTHTHTIYLLDRQTDRHTLSSRHLHAELHCSSADCGRAASVCSMFGWAGGKEETWKWVKAFRRRSYSAVLALRRSITTSHCVHAHTRWKPPLWQSHTWGGYTCSEAQFLHSKTSLSCRAGSGSRVLKIWVNTLVTPRWKRQISAFRTRVLSQRWRRQAATLSYNSRLPWIQKIIHHDENIKCFFFHVWSHLGFFVWLYLCVHRHWRLRGLSVWKT